MIDLILPNVPKIIQDTIKKDTGQDCKLTMIETLLEYSIFLNETTGARYLVQVSMRYDLFGFQNYNPTFPPVDAYIYISEQFITIHFADKLTADFKVSNKWKQGQYSSDMISKNDYWTPAFLLFYRIGGITYDYKDMVLVDKKIEE